VESAFDEGEASDWLGSIDHPSEDRLWDAKIDPRLGLMDDSA
jgi:hypothetical protein